MEGAERDKCPLLTVDLYKCDNVPRPLFFPLIDSIHCSLICSIQPMAVAGGALKTLQAVHSFGPWS